MDFGIGVINWRIQEAYIHAIQLEYTRSLLERDASLLQMIPLIQLALLSFR